MGLVKEKNGQFMSCPQPRGESSNRYADNVALGGKKLQEKHIATWLSNWRRILRCAMAPQQQQKANRVERQTAKGTGKGKGICRLRPTETK
jgi:hypothetical protein